MVRIFGMATFVLFVVVSSTGKAQSPNLGDRFKSLFTRQQNPSTLPPKLASSPVKPVPTNPKRASQPVRVTTRSGSLRRPGPETPTPVMESPSPTFARPKIGRDSQSPGRLRPLPPTKLPKPQVRTPRSPIRDQAVIPTAFESKPPKKTMVSWFKGLWSRKKPMPPQTTTPRLKTAPQNRMPIDRSSSIDPNRVYRGAGSKSDQTGRQKGRSPYSDFSETGVPRSTTGFQGRAGVGF